MRFDKAQFEMLEFMGDRNQARNHGFSMRFPYYSRFPFIENIDNLWVYTLAYIQQAHVGYVAIVCSISADMLLFSLIGILLMNFRYVQTRMETFQVQGTNEDLLRLKTIIHSHQMVLSMADLTNEIFSTTILLNFLSSIIIICMAAFQTTADNVPLIQLFSFFAMLLLELVQTGAISFLGQKLIDYTMPIPGEVPPSSNGVDLYNEKAPRKTESFLYRISTAT
uniref:Odorant receptor n=1 Tax=Megaselia scalaris TaxID=36166 RepID=T1GDI0_MEGSC